MPIPKISIIVPIYNAADYLDKCLKSLIEQTFQDIEIILINDGSTDGSERIIESFKNKDERVKVVNQQNNGRSSARNAGLKLATAELIMFCDADDRYNTDACEKMYDIMRDDNIDLGVFQIGVNYDAHEEIKSDDDVYYNLKFSGEREVSDLIMLKTDTSVCNKVFRKEIIDKYKITFPGGLNNEDYYFCNAYFSVIKKVYYLKEQLYFYNRHEGSIMSDNFDKLRCSPDHIEIAERLFEFYSQTGFLKNHLNLFWTQFLEAYWFSYRYSSKQYREKINDIARKFIDEEYNINKASDFKIILQIAAIKDGGLCHWLMKKIKC